MEMPFGKHKGEELEDIESSYLQWVISNLDLREDLNEAIEEELMNRTEGDNCFPRN